MALRDIPLMNDCLPGFVRIDLLATDAQRVLLERSGRPDTPAQVLYLAEQIEREASELALQARVAARNAAENGSRERLVDQFNSEQLRWVVSREFDLEQIRSAVRPRAALTEAVPEEKPEPEAAKRDPPLKASKPKKSAKATTRRYVAKEIPVEELADLRRQGLTYTEIGARYGFSNATVSAYGKRVLPKELQGVLPAQSEPDATTAPAEGPARERVVPDHVCLKCGEPADLANPVHDNRCLLCRLEAAGLANSAVYNSRELRIKLHDTLAHATIDEIKAFGRE